MRKLLYILSVLLILGFAACENYVDITPTGKKTVDSTETYYELVALPNRSYYPSSFALLSDNVWSKESNIIGKEFRSPIVQQTGYLLQKLERVHFDHRS